MRSGPPPLRFLMVVLGGWVAVRAAMLIPGGNETAPPGTVMAPLAIARPLPARVEPASGGRAGHGQAAPRTPIRSGQRGPCSRCRAADRRPYRANIARGRTPLPPPPAKTAEPNPPFFTAPAPPSRPRRWAASAWLFVREGEARQLATGGTLGGSQAGARLSYRLNGDAARPLALSVRAYAPLDRPRDGEAALGIEWQPLARVPVRLLAERREALGSGGRSAFALLGHGGVSDRPLLGALRLDAYGQAGIVGARARDRFADGAVRIGLPIRERLRIGGGIWGAAQPGVTRLDVGAARRAAAPGRAKPGVDRGGLAGARRGRRRAGFGARAHPRHRFLRPARAGGFRAAALAASVRASWISTCPSPACR